MSFILDALKRSEKARRVLGAAQPPPPAEPLPPPRRGWVVGAVVALLLVNAALLAWFMLTPTAPSAPGASSAALPQAPQGEVRSLAREAGSGAAASAVAEGTGVAAPRAAPDATPLADVEPALRARLAGLHVDVHGWADDPAQRFVLINLKRRVAGDALDGGITVVEIVPEGVVVELDGQRVLLPRQ